jgi:hypothetical protein
LATRFQNGGNTPPSAMLASISAVLVAASLPMASPLTAESGDGTVQIGGYIRNLSRADASWLREQLLGLTDPRGEAAVPVKVGYDDSRDGWYQVLSVDVRDLIGATEKRGDRQWSASLRRLGYREQPRYELHRFGTVWTNAHGVVEGTSSGFCSVPQTGTSTICANWAKRIALASACWPSKMAGMSLVW